MKASIVITTYQQSEILEVILKSLLNQNTRYPFEIIVCEDGGTAESYEKVWGYKTNKKGVEISYCWQQERRFRAATARNLGISEARGEIIILLDGDMVPTLDFVQQHVDFHIQNPKALLTGSRRNVDDADFFECLVSNNRLNSLMRCIRSKSFINYDEQEYREIWYQGNKPWMAVFSCNLSFPKCDYSYYSDLFVGWGIEDWDFSKRLYDKGYKVYFCKDVVAYHVDYKPVISNAFRNNDHLQMMEFARNLLIFIDQYPDEDLSICAIALKSYEIENDQLTWAGDGKDLRTEKQGIELLRKWLRDKKFYDKNETFYIRKPYNKVKQVNSVSEAESSLLNVNHAPFELINMNLYGIKPDALSRIIDKANKTQTDVAIHCK